VNLSVDQFKASVGWLESLRKRQHKHVDESVVSEYKPKLLEFISPYEYEPRNIHSADKTGLFFRALPTKSLAVKGGKCTGGQNVQTKAYSGFVCEEYGVGNGKAAKPRRFKNLKMNNLPVIWRNNKKKRRG
jgi:hypothetical protein